MTAVGGLEQWHLEWCKSELKILISVLSGCHPVDKLDFIGHSKYNMPSSNL